METTNPRRRRARVFGLGAAIALVALLLPATAGIALGHVASATCDQITNDPLPEWGVFTAQVYPTGSSTSVGTLPADTIVNGVVTAVGALTVAPGSYYVVWSDGFTQGLPFSQIADPYSEDDQNPIVVRGCDVPIFQKAIVGGSATYKDFTFTITQGDSTTTVPGSALDSNGVYSSAPIEPPYTITETTAAPRYTTTYTVGSLVKTTNCSFVGDAAAQVQDLCVITNTYVPPTSPPTSPPCTAANNCYFNTPTPPVVTPTPPVVTPTPSQTVEPSATASPTGTVAAATGKPHVTPPPTSALGGTTGQPASGAWLVLLALAGLLATILLVTPTSPARARRRR